MSLPVPSSITSAWVIGSSLGVIIAFQVLSGLIIRLTYIKGFDVFAEVVLSEIDVQSGWWSRCVHANGCRLLFILIYSHIGRGLYYGRPRIREVWVVGWAILLLLMGVAFLGYVLPWGQISFWGVTVITNLLSAIPYWGNEIVTWVWGGYCVGEDTLARFGILHFILPYAILAIRGGHIWLLHDYGSSNPVGVIAGVDKITFHPYFTYKDLYRWRVITGIIVRVVLFDPWALGDVENFIRADPLSTPNHIKPEWYFLYAYAVLRAIPRKLGGVVILLLRVLIIAVAPLKPWKSRLPMQKTVFWWWAANWVFLTWLGGQEIDNLIIYLRIIRRLLYFIFFI